MRDAGEQHMLRDFGGEHRLCKDKDLWLRGARAGDLQRTGTQAGQAAGEGSLKLLPEFALDLRDRRRSHKQTEVAFGPGNTDIAPGKLPVDGGGGWREEEANPRQGDSPKAASPCQVEREDRPWSRFPGEMQFSPDSLTATWL